MSLTRLRPFLLTVFLIMLGVGVLDFVFGFGNANVYSGLRQMIVWGMAIVGLLSLLLHLPVRFRRVDSSPSSVLEDMKTARLWARKLRIRFDLPSENTMRRTVNMMFQVLLSVFLLSLLAQQVLEIYVPFDLNFLLVEVIVLGVLSVVFKEEGSGVEQRDATKKDRPTFTIRVPFFGALRVSLSDLVNYVFLVAAGVVGAVIVFYKTQGIGWISFVVSVISGVVIVLLSILVLGEED